jgi:hypothetical protein
LDARPKTLLSSLIGRATENNNDDFVSTLTFLSSLSPAMLGYRWSDLRPVFVKLCGVGDDMLGDEISWHVALIFSNGALKNSRHGIKAGQSLVLFLYPNTEPIELRKGLPIRKVWVPLPGKLLSTTDDPRSSQAIVA